jgi:hypothetical protein
MPYRFIFLTWLLAVPANIVAVILALAVNNWMEYGYLPIRSLLPDLQGILLIALFSIPFSIPGLTGLVLLAWIAREFLFHMRAQFVFIAAGCSFLTAGCYLLLEFLISPGLQLREYLPLLTASITVVLSVLLFTRKYYYSYLKSLS